MMAVFEENPNFENSLDSVNIFDESLFIESLGSVANQVKLGDTNTELEFVYGNNRLGI